MNQKEKARIAYEKGVNETPRYHKEDMEKLASYFEEHPFHVYVRENPKITNKLFRREIVRLLNKEGYQTEKKEWKLVTPRGKRGGSGLFLKLPERKMGYGIDLHNTRRSDDDNPHVFSIWEKNNLGLVKTMKQHDVPIYCKKGGDGTYLTFLEMLGEVKEFLKENGRFCPDRDIEEYEERER